MGRVPLDHHRVDMGRAGPLRVHHEAVAVSIQAAAAVIA